MTPEWRAVVIGIGNPFRHDDGLGPAVIERLRLRDLSDQVALAESDGEPTRLLDLWHGATLAVIVDATRTAAPMPGRIHRRSLNHPSTDRAFLSTGRSASSHGIELGRAVDLAAALDRLPTSLLFYLVEVVDCSPGVGLSPPVSAAADNLTDEICTIVVPGR